MIIGRSLPALNISTFYFLYSSEYVSMKCLVWDGLYTHSCVEVVVVYVCMFSELRIVNGTSTETRDVPDARLVKV